MSESNELLPCPFCGEKLIEMSDHHGTWMGHRDTSCWESVSQIHDKRDAERWNRRAQAKRAIPSADNAKLVKRLRWHAEAFEQAPDALIYSAKIKDLREAADALTTAEAKVAAKEGEIARLTGNRAGYATRMAASKITELTTKFPGLGEDVFVHEHDYNQAENGRIAAKQDCESAEKEIERQKDAVSRFRQRAESAESLLARYQSAVMVEEPKEVASFRSSMNSPQPATLYGYRRAIVDYIDAIRTLCARQSVELEDCKKDAERYRWLRGFDHFSQVDSMLDTTEYNTLDAAVDATMPPPPPEGRGGE